MVGDCYFCGEGRCNQAHLQELFFFLRLECSGSDLCSGHFWSGTFVKDRNVGCFSKNYSCSLSREELGGRILLS